MTPILRLLLMAVSVMSVSAQAICPSDLSPGARDGYKYASQSQPVDVWPSFSRCSQAQFCSSVCTRHEMMPSNQSEAFTPAQHFAATGCEVTRTSTILSHQFCMMKHPYAGHVRPPGQHTGLSNSEEGVSTHSRILLAPLIQDSVSSPEMFDEASFMARAPRNVPVPHPPDFDSDSSSSSSSENSGSSEGQWLRAMVYTPSHEPTTLRLNLASDRLRQQQIEQAFGWIPGRLMAEYDVGTIPEDLRTRHLGCRLAQNQLDLAPHDTQVLLLIDIEFHPPAPSHAVHTVRKAMYSLPYLSANEFLKALYVDRYCEYTQLPCFLLRNGQFWHRDQGLRTHLHPGDYVRVVLPPPNPEHSHHATRCVATATYLHISNAEVDMYATVIQDWDDLVPNPHQIMTTRDLVHSDSEDDQQMLLQYHMQLQIPLRAGLRANGRTPRIGTTLGYHNVPAQGGFHTPTMQSQDRRQSIQIHSKPLEPGQLQETHECQVQVLSQVPSLPVPPFHAGPRAICLTPRIWTTLGYHNVLAPMHGLDNQRRKGSQFQEPDEMPCDYPITHVASPGTTFDRQASVSGADDIPPGVFIGSGRGSSSSAFDVCPVLSPFEGCPAVALIWYNFQIEHMIALLHPANQHLDTMANCCCVYAHYSQIMPCVFRCVLTSHSPVPCSPTTSRWYTQCHRLGEAFVPGPSDSQWALGAINPTGLAGKSVVLADLPLGIYAVSETHLTSRGKTRFLQELWHAKSKFSFSAGHDAPYKKDNMRAIGGKHTGVGFLSSFPCRSLLAGWDTNLFQTGRLHAATFQINQWCVAGGVCYGYADRADSRQVQEMTDLMLAQLTLQVVDSFPGPAFVAGDFNQEPGV